MKNALLCLSFCCIAQLSVAQIGFSGSFTKIAAPDWETLFNGSDRYAFGPDFQFKPTYQLGVDYWFRLKDYRIEFFPTLSYAQFKQTQALANASDLVAQFKLSAFGFALNTNIYPFDFEGDCHCPTWSKQNPFFKKGFFFQVSPGVLYSQNSVVEASGEPNAFDYSNVAFHLGIGIGLDIGLSDFLTLTPYARIKRHFGVEWEGLNERLPGNAAADATLNESAVNQLEAGLRLGIRWTE
ncbi:MAG: autotransporter outer membrane beta-barrel domain-containing protein [Saprospiraceae bacterium]|nr:autotransporter outer membrane beta-barrel domain-containing protein [Saprospiraceae bacterium]